MTRQYYIYMMSSKYGVLYIGVTSDLESRVQDHKDKKIEGFTEKYYCTKLVYYEEYEYIEDAIRREKQLKKWRREKKDWLIKQINPEFKDLAGDWGRDVSASSNDKKGVICTVVYTSLSIHQI